MRRKYISSIIVFAITAINITALMPVNGFFKYNYKLGHEWAYKDLTAPFDFPILKTEKELAEDIKEMNEHYIPIYELDSISAQTALNNILLDFNISPQDLNPAKTDSLNDLKKAGIILYNKLKELYSVGIISKTEEEYRQNSGTPQIIRIINGNTISSAALNTLYNTEQAKEEIEKAINRSSVTHIPDIEAFQTGKYIGANLIYNEDLNNLTKKEEQDKISVSKGFISKGSVIISENQMIDDNLFNILNSFRAEYHKNEGPTEFSVILGNFIYVAVILSLSYIFLFFFRKEFSKSFGNILFLLFIFIMMAFITAIVNKVEVLSIYMIPFAIVPLYIVTFYDLRMSIFEYVSVLMICSVMTAIPFETFFINLFAGLSGIFVLQNAYHRTRLFVTTGVILLTYIVSFIAISLMQEPDISLIKWQILPWFVVNVILLLALYQLIYFFEKIFGFVTNITLFELCDTNQFLLRELAQKAPGTFQHSMQVANLAEAAAKKIGANALYARTGALYHDIGKMVHPIYFIENISGSFNPHDKLAPEESARIIKQHVSDGIKLAKKHNIPSVIIDFIASHHGDSIIYYFYHNYLQQHDGKIEDESLFRYNGPLPVSKEATICMMADAIEAASRSLKEYNYATISALVDKIIETQISGKEFSQSMLSFGEITVIKSVFKEKLANVYHSRIEYPERK